MNDRGPFYSGSYLGNGVGHQEGWDGVEGSSRGGGHIYTPMAD